MSMPCGRVHTINWMMNTAYHTVISLVMWIYVFMRSVVCFKRRMSVGNIRIVKMTVTWSIYSRVINWHIGAAILEINAIWMRIVCREKETTLNIMN